MEGCNIILSFVVNFPCELVVSFYCKSINGPRLVKNLLLNIRQNKLKSANEKILHIQKEIDEIKREYMPVEEMVHSAEEEICFRKLFI